MEEERVHFRLKVMKLEVVECLTERCALMSERETDQNLIERCVAGDQEAFQDLFILHQDRALLFQRRRGDGA